MCIVRAEGSSNPLQGRGQQSPQDGAHPAAGRRDCAAVRAEWQDACGIALWQQPAAPQVLASALHAQTCFRALKFSQLWDSFDPMCVAGAFCAASWRSELPVVDLLAVT